jgi:glucosamine--fructose-6-phosphate aminotransferase (isomerizing)
MCGITFIYSKKNINALEHIFNSLELIQNRGYDSMGICYMNSNTNKHDILKKASTSKKDCFDLLKNIYIKKNLDSNIFSKFALGHTRWATHGGKTDYNAHPHYSQNGDIILVHNGIINNFLAIKEFLIANNYKFYSDTDSEVIANLIEYYTLTSVNFEEALKKCLQKLEGTWALIIVYTKIPDTYYITRKGSPLLLGYNTNYIICASETNGFVGLVYDYIPLSDNTIVKVNNNSYKFLGENNEYDLSNNNANNNNSVKKAIYEDFHNAKKDYAHWMLKEIMEQPETIQKAYNYGGRINNNKIKLGGLDRIINNINSIDFVYLIGCGTSFNASILGEIYFNEINYFINVKTVNACEFDENTLPNGRSIAKTVCIFLSQSGETIDVYNCLKICKQKKCLTMGIINKVDSLIAREVDCGVYLNAGSEISVASTKSFTSMLIVLSLISMWFIDNELNNIKNLNCLRVLSSNITQLLNNSKIMNKVSILKTNIINDNINSIFILGKHKLYPIACEAALKIKEVTYIHCEGFSAGSLKHGPFALLDSSNLTLLLIDYNDITNYANIKSTYYEILGRETNLFVITNSQTVIDELQINESKYILLYKLDYYNEIIFTVLLQKLAYEISIAKNINPDKPRNLAKVVTVE